MHSIPSGGEAGRFCSIASVEELQEVLAELNEKAQVYFPVILIVLAVSFAVLFVSMYLLYKRREK